MNDRIAVANKWRREKVSGLVQACSGEEPGPIDRAMLAIKIRGASPGDTGFTVSDLRWHRDRLIDRADDLEMQITDKAGKLAWMKKKAESLAEKAGRLHQKIQAVSGTIPNTELAKYVHPWRQAKADVESLLKKCEGLTKHIDDLTINADALRGAAALIGDLIDSRTASRTKAILGVPVYVDVA